MSENKKNNKLLIFISFLMMAIVMINMGFEFYLKNNTSIKMQDQIEELRPPIYNITYVRDKNCRDCFAIEAFGGVIRENNEEAEINETFVEYDSEEGKSLIAKHNITKVPSYIIEGDIKKDERLLNLFKKLGDVSDEIFVVRKARPIYYDLNTKEHIGRFNVTYINAPDCTECQDVSAHKIVLENLQFIPYKERLIDYRTEEGKELIEKHKITKVPTIVLEGDLGRIEGFDFIWEKVGTIEDKNYVFRDVESMGDYYDLVDKELKKGRELP